MIVEAMWCCGSCGLQQWFTGEQFESFRGLPPCLACGENNWQDEDEQNDGTQGAS
jgi:hypothetical protein